MSRGACERGIVLLAAGCGARMRPLTDQVPKALLPLPGEDGRTVLDAILDAVLDRSGGEVVVVTGYAAERVDAHLAARRDPHRARTVHNARWADDVNIASVACGVGALQHPERGYLIVETDLLLDDTAWDQLFGTLQACDASYWVTRGVYGPQRTGGVVHADAGGRIDCVDYRPVHDAGCDGWPKMLGMLAVGPHEVRSDIALRDAALQRSLQQYYLMPWKHGIAQLPARVLALEAGFCATFNTPAEFAAACGAWRERTAATA